VTGGIDDGEVELRGLELPQSDIDGDTTLTLGLQLVKHPSVLEGALAHLLGLLLELLDGALVDTTALVDQVTGGGRLASVDVTDHNKVAVDLLLAHGDCAEREGSDQPTIQKSGHGKQNHIQKHNSTLRTKKILQIEVEARKNQRSRAQNESQAQTGSVRWVHTHTNIQTRICE